MRYKTSPMSSDLKHSETQSHHLFTVGADAACLPFAPPSYGGQDDPGAAHGCVATPANPHGPDAAATDYAEVYFAHG